MYVTRTMRMTYMFVYFKHSLYQCSDKNCLRLEWTTQLVEQIVTVREWFESYNSNHQHCHQLTEQSWLSMFVCSVLVDINQKSSDSRQILKYYRYVWPMVSPSAMYVKSKALHSPLPYYHKLSHCQRLCHNFDDKNAFSKNKFYAWAEWGNCSASFWCRVDNTFTSSITHICMNFQNPYKECVFFKTSFAKISRHQNWRRVSKTRSGEAIKNVHRWWPFHWKWPRYLWVCRELSSSKTLLLTINANI